MRRLHVLFWLPVVLSLTSLFLPRPSFGITLAFETLSDSEAVTNQFAALGVTFSNTIALTAGISFNPFETPPKSGINVVGDEGGPITIDFSPLVTTVGGFFTYVVPLTFTAFDAALNPVGTVTSSFSSNRALTGDVGSSPNELLQLTSTRGIARVVIQGEAAGTSFVLDDLTFTPVTTAPIPEPSTLLLFTSGLAGLAWWRRIGKALSHVPE